jgi:hypothetical protein
MATVQTVSVPVDPRDPLVVRYNDGRPWSRALAEIDARIAGRPVKTYHCSAGEAGICPACTREARRAAAAADWPAWTDERWETGPHDFVVDLDTVNSWNSIAADEDMAERVKAEDQETALQALLDNAERKGWEGENLVIPAGLDRRTATLYAAWWADGRMQRTRDEEELAQDRFRQGVVLV